MKIRKYRVLAYTVSVGLWAASAMRTAKADGFLPIVQPYESFNDSPFKGMNFTSFDLVSMTALGVPSGTFFNGLVPGVTTSPSAEVLGPGFQIDSVDGAGNNGSSLFFGDGSTGLTFSFDKNVLGAFPTAAGIVWTDGVVPIHFSANDALGNSLGQINDSNPGDFNQGDGNPEHFRFYGVINSGGISSIHISNTGGGIEVDHLQFGVLATGPAPVPEPSSIALTLVGTAFVLMARKRFQNRI